VVAGGGGSTAGAGVFAATGAGGGGLLESHAASDNKIAPASASLLFVYISHPSLTLKVKTIVD
jgi:hypothetical protein